MKDMFNLKGKVAIVTGGNRGIGKAIALGLAEAGADIAIAARDEAAIAKTVEEIKAASGRRVLGVKCDVVWADQIKATVSKVLDTFGRIDILVNNAGMNHRKLPQDLTIEEWDEIHNINARSVWLYSKEVYPVMKKAGGGKIINISSIDSGHPFGMFYATAYTSSKGGVVGMTKSMALAWAPDNIQVNSILPGPILTELGRTAHQLIPSFEEKVLARCPTGKEGQPEDCAGAAIFLASHASDFVTAIALPVDGGYSSQML